MKLLLPFLLFLGLVACKKNHHQLSKITAKTMAIDSTIFPSKIVSDVITPYKKQLTVEMRKVLSYAATPLLKSDDSLQSSLGNLMADLCLEMANPIFKQKTNASIDFVLFNHGGIRTTIPVGAITKNKAFELMPFENELVVATMSGDKVERLFEYFIEEQKAHPLSKTVQLTLDQTNYKLKIKDRIFAPSKTYNVLTSDFLQHGGDRMYFFKNPKKLTFLDLKVRDAIINYLKKVDTLKAVIDNRVRIQVKP